MAKKVRKPSRRRMEGKPKQDKGGSSDYVKYLRKLSPEQRAAHIEKRAQKKTLKDSIEAVFDKNRVKLTKEFLKIIRVFVKKAQNGDVQAAKFVEKAIKEHNIKGIDLNIVTDKKAVLKFDDDLK